MIVMFPIAIMCIMPWVMNMEVKNVNTVVVDHDHSTLSTRLLDRLAESGYFTLVGTRQSYSEAISDVEKGRADIILEIPRHYERDTQAGSSPQVLIAANAVNGMNGSLGASYLSNLVTSNLSEAARERGIAPSKQTTSTLYLYNPRLDYKLFMIPALMSMLLMMLCGFLPALNIVSEKEAGTMEQINVTPVKKWVFILAKLIPYWCIGLMVFTICLLLSWLVYGITPRGSIALLYLASMLVALIFSGFGLTISAYSDTMQQAIFVMWFFVVCMMLLSGLFTPIESMPGWAERLTTLNPMRYYVDIMRTVFSKRPFLPRYASMS